MKITRISNLESSIFAIRLVRILLIIGAVLLFRVKLVFPALLCLLLIFISILSKWWSEKGLKKLTIKNYFMPKRVFAGDKTRLKVAINNDKLLPSIINWKLKLPNYINWLDAILPTDDKFLSFSTILKWYEEREITFELEVIKRGYYIFDNPHLVSSDASGLSQVEVKINEKIELIAYPSILPLDNYGIKAGDLMGERIDKRYILPDPIMIMGLREYSADMPAYLIDWKASAKQDVLMAKLIEPTADYKLCITIDVDSLFSLDEGEEAFERALSIAASISMWADEQRIPVGLLVNVSQTGLDGPIVVPVNSGTNHMLLLLEKLARAEYQLLGGWQDLLYQSNPELPWGTSLIVISTDHIHIPNAVVISARP